jgi:poly(A) polymerase
MKHRDTLVKLKSSGHDAWFVGGCVRDHLLGRECKDVDIATSATPDEVRAVFPDAEFVGAHFGVSLVKDEDGTVEVATYRVDGLYSDGRRPDRVSFTKDVKEDLKRRDFTMNALLMDEQGTVVDHVDGRADLEAGLIRCIGQPSDRFQEDGLRLMRAPRFAAQLGFTIEPVTATWMNSISYNLQEISKERISQELSKILTSGRAAYGLVLLWQANLLQYIAPALCSLSGTPQNPKHHPEGDVWTHTICVLKQLPKDCSVTLALAALFHDIGKPDTLGTKNGQPTFYGHDEVGAKKTEEILRDLRFPNEVVEKVVLMVENHMKFMVAAEMRPSKLLRWIRQDNFAELMQLHYMDAKAGSGNLEHYAFVLEKRLLTPEEKLRPTKIITGSDLVGKFNMKPGPRFKEILEAVETEQLEGRVSTKEEALAFVGGMK